MRTIPDIVRGFAAAALVIMASMTTMIGNPAAAQGGGNATLIAEVDGCRTWRVSDDLGQGQKYARLESRQIFFTKCGTSGDHSAPLPPIQGDIPDNATSVAEVDGCRVWRISDGSGKVTAAATLEPRHIYYAKCGSIPVPTQESVMR